MSHIKLYMTTTICLLLAYSSLSHAGAVLPEHGRALSMRVLQERLQTCQGSTPCEAEVTHLANLKRIDGFVIDRENNDLVLIGQVDPTWPKLHLDDLVTALRSAWHRYAKREGNTLYLSSPGVSIDPQPEVIARLQQISQFLNSSNTDTVRDQGLADWHQACHLPQKVRVEGIPFHTRSAATMLHVDYDLKRIADASLDLGIQNFHSLAARYLDAA
ncbi:DUF1598 domain-containing protein, partial [Gammaproteobacteria bacterium]|nr:DUF1598 domain-containing protein [Gammaproteobacteria bacterium]